MKILAINSLPYGSTGNIMNQILRCAQEEYGYEVESYYGKWYKDASNTYRFSHCYGYYIENRISAIISSVTGFHNIGSVFGTFQLIRRIKTFSPDVIHLHNLHLWTVNLPILFRFLKKSSVKVIWTLHDCWSFTGQCPHFTIAKCEKWKTGCHKCSQYKEYPSTFFDNTRTMWKLKKKWFSNLNNLTIITPSQWLASLVRESYLREYPLLVINNGINLNIFTHTDSNIKEKYGIKNHMVLGVAFDWGYKKGLDVFVKLAMMLSEDYQIVLVGTSEKIDKQLPKNIISIHRTENQMELAKIYTAADVFVNATRQENYPTVNMESIACGTPVVTFRTGGSPEILNEHTGYVVDVDDVDMLAKRIISVCDQTNEYSDACHAASRSFDMNERFREYVKLFREDIK
ncbi:MAG: D-inositol-3-phosphate glycosyltransferase [Eubacterium sp.]|uniref:glycosyltransferase n=1 Tax=Eubacterium sp. TaxID=142586 RepID=UPI0030527D71